MDYEYKNIIHGLECYVYSGNCIAVECHSKPQSIKVASDVAHFRHKDTCDLNFLKFDCVNKRYYCVLISESEDYDHRQGFYVAKLIELASVVSKYHNINIRAAGTNCAICKNVIQFAQPNMNNGTFICYNCRTTRSYLIPENVYLIKN